MKKLFLLLILLFAISTPAQANKAEENCKTAYSIMEGAIMQGNFAKGKMWNPLNPYNVYWQKQLIEAKNQYQIGLDYSRNHNCETVLGIEEPKWPTTVENPTGDDNPLGL